MSPTEPDITTERVVYIGRRLYNGTKIAHWYRSLEDHERTAGAHKAYLSCPIGSVLEITHPADTPSAIYIGSPNGPRLVDSWTDVDELAGWRIRDRADHQQFVTAKRLQKDLEGIPDEFDEALRTIANHMSKLNHSQRAAMTTYITARILGRSKT